MVEEKKYSKLAIASFVLALLPIVICMGVILFYFITSSPDSITALFALIFFPIIITIISSPIALLSIIFGIISLRKIRRENLKGAVFSIVGIIISGLILLFTIGIILQRAAFYI